MDLGAEVRAANSDPQRLEELFRASVRRNETELFRSAVLACYEAAPDNLLLGAWFYRFQETGDSTEPSRAVNWIAAAPMSILTGLIFWALSDFDRLVVLDGVPQLFLWWSPVATMGALLFLALTSKAGYARALALGLGALAAAGYALLLAPAIEPAWQREQVLILAVIHLPLLSWIAVGILVLGYRSSTTDRFAFLRKSIEVMMVAGLYLIAGVVFGFITVGLFEALSVSLPELWLRLIAAGGFGLLPVLAIATVYDPRVPASKQDFDQGLSQFVATMMRLLIPLTLGVLVVYGLAIPFNFSAPYENRDVLIVYNVMLFGILGLLLGATPIRGDDLSPRLQRWLRGAILTVSVLVVLISLYALSATVYRTVQGGVTPNRLTIIGWNVINIGILFWLLLGQSRTGREQWIESLQSVFSRATNAYVVWGMFLLIVLPLVFLLA